MNCKLAERIGRGTFGDVYRATDAFDNVIAVKVIPLNDADVEAVTKEVRTLSACGHHVNIVGYRTTFVDKDRLCILMDYCELGSVRNLIVPCFLLFCFLILL